MQISNALPSLADLAQKLGKRAESTDSAAGEPAKASAAKTAPPNTSAALREILGKYDVTNITPNQFSQLSQKLYEAGVISQKDLQELTSVRGDLDAAGVEPDEPVNLVQFFRDKVQKLQQQSDAGDPTAGGQLSLLLRRLDWLEKFSAVRSRPDGVGMSEVV
jgi:hypothetical protein